jgi:hypothetical protein
MTHLNTIDYYSNLLTKAPFSHSEFNFEFDKPQDSKLASFRILLNYQGLFNSDYILTETSKEIKIRFKIKSNNNTLVGYEDYPNSVLGIYTEMNIDDFLKFLESDKLSVINF